MLIKIPRGWEIPERDATPEAAYLNRRQLLVAAGLATSVSMLEAVPAGLIGAKRNPKYTLDREITPEFAGTGYNNYYEFDDRDKTNVKNLVGRFKIEPWTIEVTGLCDKPGKYDVEALVKDMPMEERTYRFRCVERWAMAVPWSGFQMSHLMKKLQPKSTAKFVRFTSVNRPGEMPNINATPWYPWPYFEALRMDEAMNELAFMSMGMYGKAIPKQNGAPIRVTVPWKYGYKNPKSIVKIEFVDKQPKTFWNQLQPAEYGFYSNVNPNKPHPRWSQAQDMVIPKMEIKKTMMYNGYEQFVAGMYNGKED
jgi:methionine sulfoxide reductase catalytic subunit